MLNTENVTNKQVVDIIMKSSEYLTTRDDICVANIVQYLIDDFQDNCISTMEHLKRTGFEDTDAYRGSRDIAKYVEHLDTPTYQDLLDKITAAVALVKLDKLL